MKIVLADGTRRRLPFVPLAMTGYRAKRIVVEAADWTQMRLMLERDPGELHRCLVQIESRYPENRAPLLTRKV